MAFTDEEKLNMAKQALKKKIMAIDEWSKFKDLILLVTPGKLKTLIKNAIDDRKSTVDDRLVDDTDLSTNLGEFSTEVENLS